MKSFSLRLALLCASLFFAISSEAQTITITQPNGGEVLSACQQYSVNWTQTGSPSNYWNIDYSLDGGTIWTSVASNYLSANGTFLWTVPPVQSSTVLMRINDSNNPSTSDLSNNFFTINVPVVVTAPNGGETWQGNTVQNITWNTIGTSGSFNLYYSLDNGTNWTIITTNYSGGNSYAWTVPSVALTTTCLVRVRDAVTSCMEDNSNNVFTITPPTPVVTSPNGGEVWYANCSNTITWNSASYFSNVQIEYSTNGGASYTVITSNTSNDGSYNWTVPTLNSTTMRVRVCNVANLSINDISNANFTVLPALTIVSPNGGEAWTTCSTYNITIDRGPCVTSIGLQYSTDNGSTWNSISANFVSQTTTQITYSWLVPNVINTASMLIQAYNAANSSIFDQTNAAINVTPNNAITVVSPNGGESIAASSNYNINWNNTGAASGIYNILFSLNAGSSWSTVASSVTGNSYNWTVNNVVSSQCMIRVQDAVNNCYLDQSDAVFSITGLAPTVTYPNGNETLYAGCTAAITWNSATYYANVRIDYSADGGTTWTAITSSTSNDGTYNWTLPNELGANYRIKVSQFNDLLVTDTSDASFTILPQLTIVSPNGGETFTVCSTYNITINRGECATSIGLQYSINGGLSYNSMTATFVAQSTNQITYAWQVPNNIGASSITIRAYNAANSIYEDITDSSINIVPNNIINVTAPNGGESIAAQSVYPITWTNTASASGIYNLYYSTNNGSSWTSIVNNLTGNAYNWTVANVPSANCLIRVQDAVNTCVQDESNAVFTITPQLATMTYPNGGETLYAGCTATITWNSATYYANVRIDYSADGGTTWTAITTSTSNDGSYNWTLPNVLGANYRVKVSQFNDLLVADASDADFSILPQLTIVYPNGGETFTVCSTYNITIDRGECATSIGLQYSINGGLSYNSMSATFVSQTTNQITFAWQVPNNIGASFITIRAYNAANSTFEDITDGAINIVPNNIINVTAPNGGESIAAQSVYPITWTNTASASGIYNLYYSTNNGSSWTSIVNNLTGNAYNWTVANVPSANCLIRVQDAVNTCVQDESNAVFTITAQVATMTYPNGGETLYAGCTATITWNSATYYANVRIDYSADGGTTWTAITTSTSNDGSYNWTLPNVLGANYRVKVSQFNDLLVADASDANFSILPQLTIVSPNGGETFTVCSTYNITIDRGECATSIGLQYSINGGLSYNSMSATFVSQTTNQITYAWQVPNNIGASSITIRAYNAANSTFEDITDGAINIVPNNIINVTAPNGGESIAAQSVYPITWTNTAGASGIYNLYYSTNNGSSWTSIVNNLTGNAYNWTVANVPSSNCLIRVQDAVNTCVQDESNAVFTIVPQVALMTYPNGGETLYAGCTATITWNSATYYANVRLDYSADGGTTWTAITSSTSNDGTYNWTLPDELGANYRVKVSQFNDLLVSDASDASFSILPQLTIVSPNGGETFTVCSTYNITIDRGECATALGLQYSINGGLSYNSMSATFVSQTTNQITYAWQVPNNIGASSITIRAYNAANSTFEDITDGAINIVPNNIINVTAPNGGESIAAQSVYPITWTNTASASGIYNLYYSTNNGSSWTSIVNNLTGNAYNWTVANIPSSNCLIRVQDAVNTCVQDESNAVFTIAPQQPQLITPNGGESLYSQSTYTITWNSATYYSNVRIDYSTDNGLTWTAITTSTSNDGTYNWTLPQADSDECLVKVSMVNDLNHFDVSDTTFTILPAVTIITPNGDNGVTIWGGCTITSITFDHTPAFNTYKIEYSTNGGSTWNTIENSWFTNVNPATYNWTMPNFPTSAALVKVSPTSNTSYFDVSDNTFTITKPVTIIQPNFGGIMQVGSTYNIQWTSDGISNIYDIFYSTNGGSSFTNIVTGYNTSNNTYPWLVPNLPSNNCRIWVRDNINACKSDTSNVAFIISTDAPPLTITTPNGVADTLAGCSAHLISWTEVADITNYDIAYSLNDGVTWNNIVTNYSTPTNTYEWNVPNNINSNSVLLKISATSDASIYDLSDAYISITPSELIATPEFISVCSNEPVQLTATGGVNYSWLPTTGLNNASIANPIATLNSTTTYTVTSTAGSCVISDEVTIEVTQNGLPVFAEITADQSGEICAGTSVTFTATAENGGSAPQYQWKINGENVGSNENTYTTATLNASDVVTCVVTSDLLCVSGNPATSNALQLDILESVIPSVTITSSTGNAICNGQDVVFTASPINGGSDPIYSWTLNGNPVGTNSSTLEGLTLNDNDNIGLSMVSNANCVSTTLANAPFLTMNVTNIPQQPSGIAGSVSLCAGETSDYLIAIVAGATTYNWTAPAGWTINGDGNLITLTASTNSGQIAVTAGNECGNSGASVLDITIEQIPATPGPISGALAVCNNGDVTYSIEEVAGADAYTWTVPSSWNGTSTSSSITITFDDQSIDGILSVIASNNCGISQEQSIAVSIGSVSISPEPIEGNATPCPGETVTFSVPVYTGAISYNWILPADWTGSSSSNTIEVVAGQSQGQIMLSTNTECGVSPASMIDVSLQQLPTIGNMINGEILTCANAEYTYNVDPGNNADEYVWSFPSGWLSTGNTNSVNAIAGNMPGLIQVYAQNNCGVSETIELSVALNAAPTAPTAINGPVELCESTNAQYNASAVEGATSYEWTLPISWTGSSVDNSIDATTGTESGFVSVVAINECGTSESTLLAVTVANIPFMTGIIHGDEVVCEGTSENYYIESVAFATTYTWDIPQGWTGSSNGLSIDINTGGESGFITVTPQNECGVGNSVDLFVLANTIPVIGAINGPAAICDGNEELYTTGVDPNIDGYSWTVPAEWTFVGSNNSILVTATGSAGEITVVGSNECGVSAPASILVDVASYPEISIDAQPSNTVCQGEEMTLFGSGGISYNYSFGVEDGIAFVPVQSATYEVIGTDENGCSSAASIDIVVQALPEVTLTLPGNETICIEIATVALSGGSPEGGVFSGVGVVSPTFFPQLVGEGVALITYSYTDQNGCVGSAEDAYVLEFCDLVEETSQKFSVNCFPNPAVESTMLMITGYNANEIIDVRVNDLTGRTVMTFVMNNNQQIIDVSQLSAGTYTISLASGNTITQVNFVKL